VLVDRFDAGLRHDFSASPIENRELGTLGPGESRKVNVNLRVVQPGRWCNTMDLTGDNGIRSSSQACVTAMQPTSPVTVPPIVTPPAGTAANTNAGQPVLAVTKSGPPRANVGELVTFTITIVNRGTVPATNLRVLDNYDIQALKPTAASDGWAMAGNDVFWTLPQLLPGQSYERKVQLQCLAPITQACNRVSVTCQEGVRQDAQSCLEIVGQRQPLAVTVKDRSDPAAVGTELIYDVRVTNNAPVSDTNVAVTVTLPNEMTPAAGIAGPGGSQPTVDGRAVRFPPVAEIRPGETLAYQIRAVPRQAGQTVVRADVTSTGSPTPLTTSETTNVIP
jgi:uncharacterized repeat protein (TIGR01451 family)